MTTTSANDGILALTAQIVTAWVSANEAGTNVVPGLIRGVHQALIGLPRDGVAAPGLPRPARSSQPAAIDRRKSVFSDHLVCPEDEQKLATLKRHLRTAHGLTPEEYRAKWRVPASYPMVALDYAKLRSGMAKASGLGRHR